MNYGTLNTLNNVLKNLKTDVATVGFTVAALMIVISLIMIMFDTDTSVVAYTKRWDTVRKLFICAALLSATGALVLFGQQLGGSMQG